MAQRISFNVEYEVMAESQKMYFDRIKNYCNFSDLVSKESVEE